MSTAASPATAPSRLRAIVGGSAGNLVEWYDWYTYSAAALYFAPIFFPKGDQTAQLLQTAAVFAVGFFARPIGAWIIWAFLLILVAVLFESAYTSISAVVKAELFPTNVRSLGVVLPYALANALFGGTAEYVALWFKSAGIERGFYVYASALSAVGLLAALAMRDTRRHSRIVED